MLWKLTEISGHKGSHVARRRINLAGARPLESSAFLTRSTTRLARRAVTLHGATKQIARQRQCSRRHPERAGKPLIHQRGETRVESPFKSDPQQDHGRVGIEILLPRFMVRARFPGIEKANKIWPLISTSMPTLILLWDARQSGSMTGKLPQCHSSDITASL